MGYVKAEEERVESEGFCEREITEVRGEAGEPNIPDIQGEDYKQGKIG